ncbi:hypothetical protein ACFWU3_36370 [Streptomyces sp. NPDC058685]|uniref:hypothetical protein n=1 Tax=Streptomyces sp. NPDC058685 TaxID=3346598 RepID=UPI003650EBCC
MSEATTQQRTARLLALARAEALRMSGTGPAHRDAGAVTAAALRTHAALCARLGSGVPVTILAACPGTLGLATFLAVYAAAGRSAAAPDRPTPPDGTVQVAEDLSPVRTSRPAVTTVTAGVPSADDPPAVGMGWSRGRCPVGAVRRGSAPPPR